MTTKTQKHRTIIPKEAEYSTVYDYLMALVSPRPIAWVSSVDKTGTHTNLAPFSFFNVFSLSPLLVGFAPLISGYTGEEKDTIRNIRQTFECVINIVSYEVVEQMNLTSSPFDYEVCEFEKAGLTKIPSDEVKVPGVAEAVARLECKVREILQFGNVGGSGSLVIAEIVKIHIAEKVFDGNEIDQYKVDTCGRLGKNYYCRTSKALFTLPRPAQKNAIGWEKLPDFIKNSDILTANDVSRLAMLQKFPTKKEIEDFKAKEGKSFIIQLGSPDKIFRRAKELIAQNQTELALKLLLTLEDL